jgi:hypothetical protein
MTLYAVYLVDGFAYVPTHGAVSLAPGVCGAISSFSPLFSTLWTVRWRWHCLHATQASQELVASFDITDGVTRWECHALSRERMMLDNCAQLVHLKFADAATCRCASRCPVASPCVCAATR